MTPKRCLLSYEIIDGEGDYTKNGIRKFASRLESFNGLDYTASELRNIAAEQARNTPFPGTQPKVHAQLSIDKQTFIPAELGVFILKPPLEEQPELAPNEDASMYLAQLVDIKTPRHGLLRGKDGTLIYFTKRYDCIGPKKKQEVLNLCQANDRCMADRYKASLEFAFDLLVEHATFPKIEKYKLYERVLFAYLIGCANLHLANIVLIKDKDVTRLAPACGFVNDTIMNFGQMSESALPINGKRSGLNYETLVDYLGVQYLGFSEAVIQKILRKFKKTLPAMEQLLDKSFMSQEKIAAYKCLLRDRARRLRLG